MARSRVQGVAETQRLLRRLMRIDQRIGENVIVKVLRKGANVVAREARANVAVDEGDLKKEIRVAKSRKRKRRSGGLVVVGIRQPAGRHGHLLEFGTGPRYQKTTGKFSGAMPAQPFMRPALANKGVAAARTIGNALVPEIEKAAVRLGGSFRGSGLSRRPRVRGKPYKVGRRRK